MSPYDFFSDNWQTIKDVLASLAPVLAALGLRRRAAAWLAEWRERRRERAAERQANDVHRADWYRRAYAELVITGTGPKERPERMSEATLHNLSVQQACAHLAEAVPHCLHGWERAKVSKLN